MSTESATQEPLSRKDFVTKNDVRWCPGCGDYAILNALQRTFSSRSELKAYLRANGLMESPARDKWGGAYPNNIEAPRVSRVHFDPRSPSSRGNGNVEASGFWVLGTDSRHPWRGGKGQGLKVSTPQETMETPQNGAAESAESSKPADILTRIATDPDFAVETFT